MSTCVSSKSSFQLLSSIKVEEEAPRVTIEKQGIVSILGSDSETTKAAASLRRTLSADMSSKKWLAQNGFTSSSPMKKIASSEKLALSAADHHHSSSSSSSFSEGEEEYYKGNKERPAQDDVWMSIQSHKEKKQQPDVWSWGSILSQKNEDSSKLPPPYVHPLVKRSASSLSEKSLEICTESLGSETGSDGFSSYPPSEVGDVDEEKDNDQQQPQPQPQPQLPQSYEDMRIAKYHYSISSRKSGPRSFPPPLPSLAREDRTSVHMQSHRENGRLVLEAVSVPPQNYFQAQREDGRLRLTFINTPSSQEEEMEDDVQEFEQVFDNFEEIEENGGSKFDDPSDKGHEEDEEEEEEVVVVVVEEEDDDDDEKVFEKEKGRREVEIVMEQNSRLPGGLMDVHKPTLMMKKLMGLDKKNLAWAPRFNKAVNLGEVEVELEDAFATPPLPQSLPVPPPPRVARLISAPPATTAATSFNAYEYFWKEKPTMASIIKPMSTAEQCQPPKSNQNKLILASHGSLKGYEQQNLVLMRGNKAEYLVPLFRGCKESRARSLLLCEPNCIATSS
ncbi:uncharacterized protein [Coffea arabica]|uniref:FAF domain-containing protein n=1 Tax=Coffea arabica TaxID=13443 RepID=A0A6P6TW39_COFAR|nr:protein FAF-like, chloroplastic [Coffea arabica]